MAHRNLPQRASARRHRYGSGSQLIVELIPADTRVEAWSKAVRLQLGERRQEYQLILRISEPWVAARNENQVEEALNALYIKHPDKKSEDKRPYTVNTVAETIFPAWDYVRSGMEETSRSYLRRYRQFRQGHPPWGTYAHRLFSTGEDSGREDATAGNPLLTMIGTMRRENAKRSQSKTSNYELSLHRHIDARKPSNRACLMHLSFKLLKGKVHLTALYRSHEYAYKAYGNLLGLARLQAAVSREVNATPGELVVHSTRAWLGGSMPQGELRRVAELAA